MKDKEMSVEITRHPLHNEPSVLFAESGATFVIPRDKEGLEAAEAALKRALKSVEHFKRVLDSSDSFLELTTPV